MGDALTNLLIETNPAPAPTRLPATLTEEIYAKVRRRIAVEPTEPRRRLPRRGYIVAVVAATVLVVPALALSGVLDTLFGFSSQGTPPSVSIASDSLSILSRMGATPDTVRLIASRGGTAFYAARSTNGQICVGTADAAAPSLSFEQLQCSSQGAADSFPSPAVPVLQTAPVYGQDGSSDVFMQQLAGFAADGVGRITVSGPTGIVASADISDNVFEAPVPHEPITSIEAYDAAGNEIWTRPLTH